MYISICICIYIYMNELRYVPLASQQAPEETALS